MLIIFRYICSLPDLREVDAIIVEADADFLKRMCTWVEVAEPAWDASDVQ